MNEINLDNIYLVKSKSNYIIYSDHKKKDRIQLKLCNVRCPFGVEKYMGKEIINFEFQNKKNDNISINNYNTIIIIDNYFKKISKELDNVGYMSCMRCTYGCDPLLRTHVSSKNNLITTIVKKENENLSIYDIKDKFCDIVIELSSIWKRTDSYGLIITIKEIELIG